MVISSQERIFLKWQYINMWVYSLFFFFFFFKRCARNARSFFWVFGFHRINIDEVMAVSVLSNKSISIFTYNKWHLSPLAYFTSSVICYWWSKNRFTLPRRSRITRCTPSKSISIFTCNKWHLSPLAGVLLLNLPIFFHLRILAKEYRYYGCVS